MKPEDKFIEILAENLSLISLPDEKIIELDLGCGKGTFSTLLAKKYPGRLILATDVMIGRLRKLYKRNIREKVENIRLLRGDAWFLFNQCIPDGKISRVHILCPDPWPKEKHRSNRLISSEFASRLYSKLCSNGVFHFSTDDKEYFSSACKVIEKSGLFVRNDDAVSDVINIKTDFEKRWNLRGLDVFHAAWSKK